MLHIIKNFFLFFNLVLNYGISPSTILKNNKALENTEKRDKT
jgi:hypothetical protein